MTKIIFIVVFLINGCTNIPFQSHELSIEELSELNLMKAEKVLETELDKLSGRILSGYAADPLLGQKFLKMNKKLQLEWLKYVETSCKIEAFDIDEKYPAYRTAVDLCRSKMTLERIEVVKNILSSN